MGDDMIGKTSRGSYVGLAAFIHWVSAAFILTQIWLGFSFEDAPKGTPERDLLFTWHKTVGVIILLLAVWRIIVRLKNPPPPFPAQTAKWGRALAVWTHRLFYFLLFALPLTGLMAVSRGGATTDLIGGIPFPTIPDIFGLHDAHEPLVFGLIGLLVLHVAGALKHLFIDKGALARRMPPFTGA